MPKMRLTHRQVEVFRALMITGSMTKAARFLSVTQPAVSKIITQMEEELNFSLFDRKQGKLNPTDDAQILYSEVKQSYSGLEAVKRTARRIQNYTGGSLRVALMPAFAAGFITKVVCRLYENGSDTELSLQGYGSDEIVELVASGLYDIGFVTTPVDSTRIYMGPVMSIPSYCILPQNHPLSDRHEISIFDLDGESFIATPEGTSSRLRIDSLFSSMNVSRNLRIEARWSLTISELVHAGLGCSIVDGFTASAYAKHGGTVKPLKENIDFTFAYITPKVSTKIDILKQFHDAFNQEFDSFQAELLNNIF